MKRLTVLLTGLLAAAVCLAALAPAGAQAPAPTKAKRAYGWKKSAHGCACAAPTYAAAAHLLHSPPPRVDLRPGMPPVYDQGQLGSCTGNAIAGAIHYDELRQKARGPQPPSRLFIYYNERALEGTVGEDAGAAIADGIRSLSRFGWCPESAWPYDVSRFTQKPPASAYATARRNLVRDYAAVHQDAAHFRAALAAGHPIVIGFDVAESFESDGVAQTGVYNPQPGEEVVGGHAVLIVGYDAPTDVFIVRNSWGADWGQGGYFTVPQAVFLDPRVAGDCWVVNTIPPPRK